MLYNPRIPSISGSDIAEFLNKSLLGPDLAVTTPAAAAKCRPGALVYLDNGDQNTPVSQEKLQGALVLLTSPYPENAGFSQILTPNPKLDFVSIVNEFFISPPERRIDPSAVVSPKAQIGRQAHIGPGCVVGPECVLGNNVTLMNRVVLSGPVQIGNAVTIKDHAVIGSEGYVFIRNEVGDPMHVPHLGGIIIGDGVWIGANTTIERAELLDTVIGKGAKIDDLVHVGGGCRVGEQAMLTAGVILGRNSVVGNDSWLAPNVSIREGIHVAERTTIGIGSVVIRDTEPDKTYVGVPARILSKP